MDPAKNAQRHVQYIGVPTPSDPSFSFFSSPKLEFSDAYDCNIAISDVDTFVYVPAPFTVSLSTPLLIVTG